MEREAEEGRSRERGVGGGTGHDAQRAVAMTGLVGTLNFWASSEEGERFEQQKGFGKRYLRAS